MEGERLEFVSFVLGVGFIFLSGIFLFLLIGFFDAEITGLAASSTVDVEFDFEDPVNDSVNESFVPVVNNIPPVSNEPFVPAAIVYDKNVVDSEGNYIGLDEDDITFVFWGLIIGSMILFVVIIGTTVFIISRGRKKRGVGVRKRNVVSGNDIKMLSLSVPKPSAVSSPVEKKKMPVTKKATVAAVKQPVAATIKPVVPIAKSVPILLPKPVPELTPKLAPAVSSETIKSGVVSSLEYIKNYSVSFSKDSKERIRYFLNNANQFVVKKDFVGAKQLYSWIGAEYKNLKRHDDLLYREILDLKRSLG